MKYGFHINSESRNDVINICFILAIAIVLSDTVIRQVQIQAQEQHEKTDFPSLQVDTRPIPSNEEILQYITKNIPSLPIRLWEKYKDQRHSMFYDNNTCAPYPSIADLAYNSNYWQTFRMLNGTYQLFGAYYDIRNHSAEKPSIRILAMVDREKPASTIGCQIWFEGQSKPILSETHNFRYIWHNFWGGNFDGIYQPYLFNCLLPQDIPGPPVSVSLVERACDTASNHLRVYYNLPERKNSFAVCVKGLNLIYSDLSTRLVEWLEILFLFGVDKAFFYELNLHPNISKVLKYYENLGRVVITPLTLPGGKPNIGSLQRRYIANNLLRKRLNEVIPYNDCFYKNLYMYDYITLLDIDELIVPVNESDWGGLMRKIEEKTKGKSSEFASLNARNVYFFDDMKNNKSNVNVDDIPSYCHVLRHVFRAQNCSPPYFSIKSFYRTSDVLTLHNHMPVEILPSPLIKYSYTIDIDMAKMHHYRKNCIADYSKKDCLRFWEDPKEDTTMLKFKDKISPKVREVLNTLGFIESK